MKIGATSETVQVTADSPMLEVQKPVQAVNISGDMQRALPLGTRKDFSEFLEVTPGVTARTFDQGTGGQVYMLRGSEIENHVVQVDGADMGSFRQGWAGLYVGLSTDSIEDTQVKTGGVGVIINIATPSGTNTFKGAASTIYQAKAWNGNNAAPGGQSVYNKVFQPDVSLGGPILRDRLFFFGAFRYSDRETGIFRSADQLKASADVDPTFTPFANGGKNKYYFVKATAQLSPQHQLYVFYQRDFNPEVAAFPTDTKTFNITAFGGNGFGTRLSSVWGSSVTTRVLAAYNDKSINGTFDAFAGHFFNNPEQDFYSSSFKSGASYKGNGLLATTNNFDYVASPTSKLTFQADLTYFKEGWMGSHEIQTGLLAQPRLSNENDNIYVNGGSSFEELALIDPKNVNGGSYLFHRRVYDATSVVASSRLAQDYGVYIQDGWKPSSRLTVTAGVRADNVRVRDRAYNVDVQNSWSIGPRVGATYVLTADEKMSFARTTGASPISPSRGTCRAQAARRSDRPSSTSIQMGRRSDPPSQYLGRRSRTATRSSIPIGTSRSSMSGFSAIGGNSQASSVSTPASFDGITRIGRPTSKPTASTRAACSAASRTSTRTRFTW